jgi:hypothetical protein
MDKPESDSLQTMPGTGRRDRSPNYPSLTFSEALTATKKIWDQDKRHPVSVTLAAQHLGYKQENGVTIPMMASMKRYGLLIPAGKDLRVSDDANTIFLYGQDTPEGLAVIKRLAMLPALFTQVLEKFPDGLPSDANLRARLQDEWGFASPKAADKFIESLRQAVALTSKDGVAGSDQVVDNGVQVNEEQPMTHTQETALRTPPAASTQSRSSIPHPMSSSPQSGTQSRPWNLGGGAIMTVTIPNTLTQKNIEKLRKYVEALANEASIAWDDESGKNGHNEA